MRPDAAVASVTGPSARPSGSVGPVVLAPAVRAATLRPSLSDRPPRVLVVDADRARRTLHCAVLRQDGCEIQELDAASGVGRALDEFEPDLVLLDATLPDRSGVDVCRELRGTDAGRLTPIVLLSDTATDEESVARGLLAGADDYLTSPHRLVEMRARVRVQLRNKRDREVLFRVRVERDAFKREATLDPLTGLSNRRSFESALARQMAFGGTFALLFVDADHFKRINDTCGHEVGDLALQAIADRIKRGVRPDDAAGRIGGEEFVVLAADVTAQAALVVAERLRASVEAITLPRLDAGRRVTVSIGVAVYEPARPDATPEALLKRADEAVYAAKGAGRNRVVLAPPAPRDEADESPTEPPASVSDFTHHDSAILPKIDFAIEGGSVSSALELELVRKLGDRKVAIPVLPEVAAEAMKLAHDPNADAVRLARLIDRSPVIAARFLAVANSALYARGGKMSSTRTAIVRLGMQGARDLVFQIACDPANAPLARYHDAVARSFRSSVLAAITARAVCWELHEKLDHAYLYGLLRDLGEARIYRILAAIQPAPDAAAVHDLVRRYHPRAGAAVAVAWKLPADIVEVCAHHHDESHAASSLPVRITMIADKLVSAAETPGDAGLSQGDVDLLERLGVPEGRVMSLVEATRDSARAL